MVQTGHFQKTEFLKNLSSMGICFFLSLGFLFSFINTSTAQVYVSASGTLVGCVGNDGSATAWPSGGSGWYEYAWNNGGTTKTIDGLAAGTYSVTVTDTDTGYSASTTVTLQQWESDLTAYATGTLVGCLGNDGTATGHASGGSGWYQFTWSNGVVQEGSDQTYSTITGLAAGTYSVTILDTDTGCSATASVTLEQYEPDLVVYASGTDAICGANGSVNAYATGGSDWYEYTWSTGDTGTYVNGLAPGTYTVTVLDTDTNCSATDEVTIGDSDNLEISTSSTLVSCLGSDGTASVEATGGTGEYTYEWSNGGSTSTITDLDAGTYGVTVTSGNCEEIAEVIVEDFVSDIAVSVEGTDALCGEGGTATATATGGTGEYTYEWSNGATTAALDGLTEGTYSVTVTDSDGCTAEGSVTIGNLDPMAGEISTTDPTSVCIGDGTADLVNVTASGSNSTNFAWVITDADGNIIGLPAGPPFDFDGAGEAGVCLIWYLAYEGEITGAEVGNNASELMGCFELSNPIEITRTVTPTVEIVPDSPTACYNETIAFSANTTGEDLTYAWSADGGTFDDATSANPVYTMMTPGSYTITLEVNSNGCTATASTVVTIVQAIAGTISTEDPTTVCVGNGVADIVDVTVEGNSSPESAWVITDADGNILDLPAGPPFDFEGAGEGVCLIWYVAYIGELTGAEVGANAADLEGCYNLSNPIEVTRIQAPEVSIFQSAFIVCDGGGVAMYAIGEEGLSYTWTADAGNLSNATGGETTFQMGMPGTYTITLTGTRDSDGCSNTATATVTVVDFSISLTIDTIDECGDTGSISVDCDSGDCDYGYTWSNGETGSSITDLDAGTYTVEVLDNETGCTITETVVLEAEFREIGDYVWFDNNENCTQDSWEQGVEHVKVHLIEAGIDGEACTEDDVHLMHRYTDADGHYLFECVPVGTYYIRFDIDLYTNHQFTCTDGDDLSIEAGGTGVNTGGAGNSGDACAHGEEIDHNALGNNNDNNDSDATAKENTPSSGTTDVFTLTSTSGNDYSFDAGIHLTCNDLNYGGSLCGGQQVCAGEIPNTINSCDAAGGGGSQAIEYLWMCTTDETLPIALWDAIPDSDTPCYSPTEPLYQNKYYTRCARRAGCDAYLAESNVVLIEVLQCSGENINLNVITETADAFSFYPNPVLDELNVQNNISFDTDVTIDLLTLTGNVIRTVPIKRGTVINQQMDLGDSPAGTYFIRINREGKATEMFKITKMK